MENKIKVRIVGTHPLTGESTHGHSEVLMTMPQTQEIVREAEEKGFLVYDEKAEKPISVENLETGTSILIMPPVSGG